jgi:hypothetical protein
MTAPAPIFTNIHGNQYETVASRIKRFRYDHEDGSIHTEVAIQGDNIVTKADVSVRGDGELCHLASGTAEEFRGTSQINNTSAVENCETSAIGRALGIAGYDASGNSVATADEVSNAIHQQNNQPRQQAMKQAYGGQPQEPAPTPAPAPAQHTPGPDGKIVATYTPTQVESVELKRKSDGRPFTKYVVHCGDGTKLTTLNNNMAECAGAAINQSSDVEVEHMAANRWGDCDMKGIAIVDVMADAIPEDEIPF